MSIVSWLLNSDTPYSQGSDNADGISQYEGNTPRPEQELLPGQKTRTDFWGGGVGEWTSPNGDKNSGVAIEGGAFKTGQELGEGWTNGEGWGIGWDFGVGTGGANCVNTSNTRKDGTQVATHSAGVSGNAVEASITAGTQSENARFGLSEGFGAGLRIHEADLDRDGDGETVGFGIDLGPASFDVKSDTIGKFLQDPASILPLQDPLMPQFGSMIPDLF